MALQSSGQISLGNIYDEFHLNSDSKNDVSISGYLRSGSRVPNTAPNNNIPTVTSSGIRFSNYYGGTALIDGYQDYSNYGGASSNYSSSFTVPERVYRLKISVSGGGGGGGGNLGPGCGSVAHNSGSGGGGAGYFIGTVSVVPGQVLSFSLGYGGAGGTSRNNSGTFPGEGCTNGYSGSSSSITGTNFTISCTGGRCGRGPGSGTSDGQRTAYNNCGHAPQSGGPGGSSSHSGSAIITGTDYGGNTGGSGNWGCEGCCASAGSGGASLAASPGAAGACSSGLDGYIGGSGGSGCGGNTPGYWGQTYSPRSVGTGGWGGPGYVRFVWGPLI